MNFDAESSGAALKALEAVERKAAEADPAAEPTAFLDFEPVTGRLARR